MRAAGQNIKDEDAFKIAEEMVGDAKTRELLLGGNAISSHGTCNIT